MKRTLVIANACFSETTSNGRTLTELFKMGDSNKLAQFFVYGIPERKICDNFYRVGDREALYSLLFPKKSGCIVKHDESLVEKHSSSACPPSRKTPFKMLLREIVWKFGRWKNKQLWNWIEQFHPEMIFLFLANNVFLIRFARIIAKRYHIPVVVYTTEGYYFMNYNYLTHKPSVAYYLYHKWLCNAYRKLTPYVKHGYFNTTYLKDLYQKEFGYSCSCIMNTSRMEFRCNAALPADAPIRVSYLGNLGLGRHKALIELAESLSEIDTDLCLDVYGHAPSPEIKSDLENNRNIRFHGFVSYDDVVKIIYASSLIVHVEWNDPIMNRELKYAFSTKIADSLSSGTPLLLYAYEGLTETAFLKENDCAFVASNREDLKKILKQALTDADRRQEIVTNAKSVKEKYLTGNDVFIQSFI